MTNSPAFSPSDFGAFVQQCRLAKDQSLHEVAAAAGISKGYLSEIEAGQHTPSLSTALRLAVTLRFSLDAYGGLREIDADLRYRLASAQLWVAASASHLDIANRYLSESMGLLGISVSAEDILPTQEDLDEAAV